MKKLIFPLICALALFACSPDKTDDTPEANLSIENLPDDNPLIYASGGEAVVKIECDSEWQVDIVESDASQWLTITSKISTDHNGSVTIKTAPNTTNSDRTATIKITAGDKEKELKIKQLQNPFTRREVNSRDAYTSLTIRYNGSVSNVTKLITLLPVPESNIYQDITKWKAIKGNIGTANDNQTRYIGRVFTTSTIPASGSDVLRQEYHITNYAVSTNFDAITTIIKPDTDSDIYKEYVLKDDQINDRNNATIKANADRMWNESGKNIIDYARACYLWVANTMKYLNPNTGLHPVAEILANGGGDCGNQATVFISLLRNKEIPARHVVLVRTDGSFHVRAEFYMAGYGWIPVDVNAKNMVPSGDFFGRNEDSAEVVMNRNLTYQINIDNQKLQLVMLQNYAWWYWISSGKTSFSLSYETREK